ncbi:MAG: heme-binding protein [Gemmatimonadota bacterium]
MALFRETRVLTLEGAKRLAAAAEAEALRHKWTVAIALVDPSGGLILFHCLDGTQAASQDIAVAKARTAARLKRPTKALEDGIAGGRHALLTVPGALALEGGVPIVVDGHLLGAIGISGMTSTEDGQVAAAALAAIA